jgi:hypothetical protein
MCLATKGFPYYSITKYVNMYIRENFDVKISDF